MQIVDLREDYKLVRETASTDTAFPTVAPTTTEPTGDGIIPVSGSGPFCCQKLRILPIGTDLADETFDLRLYGWSKIDTLWIPVLLAELTCTLGASVGVSGEDVADTTFFVDTLVLDVGNSSSCEILSVANDTIAHILMDVKGHEKIGVYFDLVTAASANALYARV